ncbi:hypothetical protein ACN26Z_11550 [Verrucosispora sp. WMMD703]|uniref:Uncharacterized protein n=1 Tax=Micromonospora sediminimaris TaxID=547162 RepID=A0A9W5XJN9_9ACTN|nr:MULTISPECIES: hypothetical protein [Micromonospora]WFE43907.1 hypothetical protein O7624_05980 [Verrucosispora sp. WMMD1129]GIJ33530.1 hypothetical protein Vse01_26780 [Micromonospora sediminimaris]SFC91256.1 hypothetical protein SAMN05216284_108217 [Micromonospora sediminimaris]
MSGEPTNSATEHREQAVESERGALLTVLVMVLLGVAGIFAVS